MIYCELIKLSGFGYQIMADLKHEAPEVLATEEIYHGNVFDVSVYTIREGETIYKRDVVHHPGGAGAVAVFDDMTIALVRQYRHPVVRYTLEIPAGRLEPPERPEDCAARELEEEIGLRADNIEKLTEFFSTPGFCEEKLWVYLATGLRETKQSLEEDELVEIVRVSFPRAFEMISDGEIEDAKTIIGITLAASRLNVQSSSIEAGYPSV
jgi:ADP-ribose pyrophosphatase